MLKSKWMNTGTVLKMNAINYPDKLGWEDKNRSYTFREWNDRSCRLANGLRGLGVNQGDTFGVIAYNRGEWMDIYASCPKGGQIVVPIMFRLAGPEIEYITRQPAAADFLRKTGDFTSEDWKKAGQLVDLAGLGKGGKRDK